ncbi:hypothetical protein DFP78_102197 [Photobacterium lutimaris]|nr:hypothetical protein DFP78_102197 [Photobacterium lutimaris]
MPLAHVAAVRNTSVAADNKKGVTNLVTPIYSAQYEMMI